MQNKKKEVALNFLIGTLTLSPSNTVQFKSLTISEAANQQTISQAGSFRLTEYSLRGLDKQGGRTNSQRNLDERSIAERSINYMQQRQSTASVGSRAHRLNATKSATNGDKIFSTPQHPKKGSIDGVKGALEGSATEDAPYF